MYVYSSYAGNSSVLRSHVAMDLDRRGSKKDLKFSRRYLDANRVTYEVSSDLQRLGYTILMAYV